MVHSSNRSASCQQVAFGIFRKLFTQKLVSLACRLSSELIRGLHLDRQTAPCEECPVLLSEMCSCFRLRELLEPSIFSQPLSTEQSLNLRGSIM